MTDGKTTVQKEERGNDRYEVSVSGRNTRNLWCRARTISKNVNERELDLVRHEVKRTRTEKEEEV